MTLRGREFFSQEQRDEFMKILEDEWILGTYYTFSKHDLEIIKKHRTDENRIGFALQLAVLRYPGWSYSYVKSIPKSVVSYIAKQIGTGVVPARKYPQRENTLWVHLKEIREEYGFTTFTDSEYQKTFQYICQLSLENEGTLYLFHSCLNFLRENRIIFPGITTLENLIWEAKTETERKIFDTLENSLSKSQKDKLDALLIPKHELEERNLTPLGWLKIPIGFPSPDTFLKLAEKLEYIRELELSHNLIEHFHPNRVIQIYRMAMRYEPYALREFKEHKRYALLVILLINLSKDLTGVAVFFLGQRIKHMFSLVISRDNIKMNDVIPFLINYSFWSYEKTGSFETRILLK
ncbi:MAG: DUF4158 domain-containing protein [Fusobacteriaceae bacterium]